MDPFDLEKAKQGRQIVHKDGRKVSDWHAFMIGSQEIYLMVQFEGNDKVYSHTFRRDGSSYSGDTVGFAPERAVEYRIHHKSGVVDTSVRIPSNHKDNPSINFIHKVTCNPDGSDPTIERVD